MQHIEILGFFSMPGGMEWLIILFVALLIFGRRLPSLMRSLGGSVREFKKGVSVDEENEKAEEESDDGERKTRGKAADGDDEAAADRTDADPGSTEDR